MKFMDESGMEWEVIIDEETIFAMRLVTRGHAFSGVADLPQDLTDIVKCIAVACSNDCTRRGIEARDLLPKLNGQTLNVALDAFIRAYLTFWEPLFPDMTGEVRQRWNEAKKKMATKRQVYRERLAMV